MYQWILFDLAGVIVQIYFGGKKKIKIDNKIVAAKSLYPLYEGKIYVNFMIGEASEEDVINNFIKKSGTDLSKNQIQKVLRQNAYYIKGMRSLLLKLRQKYKLAVFTNEGREWTQYKIDALKLNSHFSHIVESNKLGKLKPSKTFFEKALKIIKAKPEECLFIDDKEENCKGARKIGIKSITFKNPKQLKNELLSSGIVIK